MTRKTTIEKRLTHATAKKAGALSLFQRAADELDEAAAEAQVLADEADAQRRHFETLAQVAEQEKREATASAAQLRILIGG